MCAEIVSFNTNCLSQSISFIVNNTTHSKQTTEGQSKINHLPTATHLMWGILMEHYATALGSTKTNVSGITRRIHVNINVQCSNTLTHKHTRLVETHKYLITLYTKATVVSILYLWQHYTRNSLKLTTNKPNYSVVVVIVHMHVSAYESRPQFCLHNYVYRC